MHLTQPFTFLLAVLLSYTTAHSDSDSVYGGPSARSRTSLPAVITSCTKPNVVALTFDDGPYINMTDISDMFTKHDVKATFFVNGDNYDCIYDPDVVKRVQYTFNAGHQIASHTWSHPNLNKCSADKIALEIDRLDAALLKILGIKTQFLRPPYGNYNNQVRQVAASRNKTLLTWDFDSGDSVGEDWEDSETDYDAQIQNHVENLIALNHETQPDTVAHIVPWVIPELQSNGYELVTVADCLGLDPYTFKGPFGTELVDMQEVMPSSSDHSISS
ncbi:putative chitin deacetylase [Mycena amicta]|nr:putative chitin deacetylase [Mycena amicta]